MNLPEEVDLHRKSIRTDGYPMSIGELSAMYKEGDLELHPEFQRYFRWTDEQKSRLLESLLLGIPIPSVFVHQREDGIWDIIDGLQRLSAIFQVMGILKDEKGEVLPPLTLHATRYLAHLDKKKWSNPGLDESELEESLKRIIKRSKLDMKIVLRESDADTKLELFQRLNTGGASLSPQELRNCQILMVSDSALDRIKSLASFEPFQNCIALTDRYSDSQYDLELVVRFIALRNHSEDMERIGDLGPFLDNTITAIAKNLEFDWDTEIQVFERTFTLLEASLGEESFHRYDSISEGFKGGFLISVFEILALGLGNLVEKSPAVNPEISDIAKKLWTGSTIIRDIRGRNAAYRLRSTLDYGRKAFSE